jgi:hypothetical protein
VGIANVQALAHTVVNNNSGILSRRSGPNKDRCEVPTIERQVKR